MTSTSFHSIKFKDPRAKSIIEERITTPEGDVEVKTYHKEKLLGKGNSGSVYQVMETQTQRLLAAKIVSKAFLKKGNGQQKLVSEIEIHKALRHAHVAEVHHVFEDKDNVYILLELCPNNTLKHYLTAKRSIPEVEVQYYMYQIIDGLRYIHSKGVVHRDLKLRNILLSEDMKIKIGDFGLATKVDPSGEKLKAVCGTPNFVAPEVLAQTGYSYEADIWSLGVICYTLLAGKMPFDMVDKKDIYKKIQKIEYSFPEELEISGPAKDFISKILVIDPLKRPSFDDMLKHPFLNTRGKILRTMPTPIPNTGSSTSFIENLKARKVTEIQKVHSEPSADITDRPDRPERLRRTRTMIEPLKLTVFKRRLPSLAAKTGIEDLKSGIKSAEDRVTSQKGTPSTQASWKSSLPIITEGDAAAKRLKLDPEAKPKEEDICVVNYLEYPKHGIGYILSNNSIGVVFNDSTKMILYPPYMNFDYIVKTFVEKKEVRTTHGLLDFPKELGQKVSVLQRFRNYFNKNKEAGSADVVLGLENRRKPTQILSKKKINTGPVFIRKWIKTKQALIFRFSSQVWQIMLKDNTMLLINTAKQIVTYDDGEGDKLSWQLEEVPDCGNEEVIKRMAYAQEVIKASRKMEKEAN